MKRGCPDHPKVKWLARTLDIPVYGAVGLLELLWHAAAKYARRGNLGRFSDQDIADLVHWERLASELVNGLVECHWLDRHPTYRLVVHHWEQHADDAVKKTLRNRGETFITIPETDGTKPDTLDNERAFPEKDGPLPETVGHPAGNGSPKPEPSLALPEPSLALPEPSFCSEPEAGLQADSDVLFLTFPCQGKQKTWDLRQSKMEEYRETYPGLNIENEIRAALQWTRDNPTKRKTSKGMPAFLNRWLTTAVDRPRKGNGKERPWDEEETDDEKLARIPPLTEEQKRNIDVMFRRDLK